MVPAAPNACMTLHDPTSKLLCSYSITLTFSYDDDDDDDDDDVGVQRVGEEGDECCV